MGTPHKHAELIKAWADGAEIEYRINFSYAWQPATSPSWGSDLEYRIKPEPKPDIVYYGVFSLGGVNVLDSYFTKMNDDGDHIKVTFDGETGKLKLAEVL